MRCHHLKTAGCLRQEKMNPRNGEGRPDTSKNLPDFEWYLVAEVNLVQKVIEINRAPYWMGSWVNAIDSYLAFQLVKGPSVFNGWIQLSFDKANEQIVLHHAAFSLQPGVDIKAGL